MKYLAGLFSGSLLDRQWEFFLPGGCLTRVEEAERSECPLKSLPVR